MTDRPAREAEAVECFAEIAIGRLDPRDGRPGDDYYASLYGRLLADVGLEAAAILRAVN